MNMDKQTIRKYRLEKWKGRYKESPLPHPRRCPQCLKSDCIEYLADAVSVPFLMCIRCRWTFYFTLAEVIGCVVRSLGLTPEQVNYGDCSILAEEVCQLWPGAQKLWDYQTLDGPPGPTHCFIKVGDRYYDSERPGGVTDWKELPFFSRVAIEV